MNSLLDRFLRRTRFLKVIRNLPKNAIVCDIGCGYNATFLLEISSFLKYGIGLDRSVGNFANQKIKLKHVQIEKIIPLRSKEFDVVTMIAVLEHLNYPQEVLDEVYRILKNGGRLILTTPTPLVKPILETLAGLRLINKKDIQEHKNYFWPENIKKMLKLANFKEENIKTKFFEFGLNNLVIAKK